MLCLQTLSVSDGLTSRFRKRLRQPVAHAQGSQIIDDARLMQKKRAKRSDILPGAFLQPFHILSPGFYRQRHRRGMTPLFRNISRLAPNHMF